MFSLLFAQVNIILNVFSLAFVQEKVLCSLLQRTMFVCAIIEYISLKLTRWLDLPSKLSTHNFKLSFQKIQAAFTTVKTSFELHTCE